MPIEVGRPAPDFELADQHGQTVRLSDFRGRKRVMAVFYPLAFSGICSGELRQLRDHADEFAERNIQLLGISVDSMFAQRVWADQEGVDFPLLADFWPHGEVARAYGVFDDARGVALRGSFLVDTGGVVRWSIVNPISRERDLDDYRKAFVELD
ncbi:peroxiredoxin [Thermobifida cellulosilytica]|uniref:Alkyl hydroperoxide reductase E n=1 Tax=Thermobifida cellulosilytica TB100 TaxID=665004 RepID=A0A147KJE3_THECS|nr:peroxiredoxin [Thermobifida cellulosilytica]KUP97339.1 peroxiredoxin [Thermobifida cellulosilytica TB100]